MQEVTFMEPQEVFCYDKKEFYHMISIIDNDIYDKNSDCMDLYVISVYKKII